MLKACGKDHVEELAVAEHCGITNRLHPFQKTTRKPVALEWWDSPLSPRQI